jgi:histidinol-phosphate/aromatic aminotransferase/cobyric acid decarboxylase-like protein
VRITVGTQVQMDQCLEALREVLAELKPSAEVRV